MTGLQQLSPWADTILTKSPAQSMVVGQLGQSLDGFIATETGQSKYINGAGGLHHLHRLRACVDAVLVGVGTVVADDPMLTVRLCDGPSPARVVLDPHGRVPKNAKLFQDDGCRRIVLTKNKVNLSLPAGVEIIDLGWPQAATTAHPSQIHPQHILEVLARAGLHRVLVEGGAHTIGQFINARCLDYLHLIVAPMILGRGKSGLNLPALQSMAQAQRFKVNAYSMAPDVLFECDLRAQPL